MDHLDKVLNRVCKILTCKNVVHRFFIDRARKSEELVKKLKDRVHNLLDLYIIHDFAYIVMVIVRKVLNRGLKQYH